MTITLDDAVLPIIRTWGEQVGILATVDFHRSLQTTVMQQHAASPVLQLMLAACEAGFTGQLEEDVCSVAAALRAHDHEPTSDVLSETLEARVDRLLQTLSDASSPVRA
ncbi:MAG: hypothetical protein JWM02_3659 [Frankiales bacterium]|nr:hypothetical protein [Frankiales bacterium]